MVLNVMRLVRGLNSTTDQVSGRLSEAHRATVNQKQLVQSKFKGLELCELMLLIVLLYLCVTSKI